MPYHSKTHYRLQGPPPPLPRHFGPEAVDALLAGTARWTCGGTCGR
ncbi:hypothetical protein SFUMM280S_04887 [Streptomyces fumanus]